MHLHCLIKTVLHLVPHFEFVQRENCDDII